jgi:hypothetical protein
MLVHFLFHHLPIAVLLAEFLAEVELFAVHHRDVIRGAGDDDRGGGRVSRATLKGQDRLAGTLSHRIMRQPDHMKEQPGQAGQEEKEPDSFQGLI